MNTTDRVLARLRKQCLGFPETGETNAFGHPNFRAGKRTFAAYEFVKGRPSIALRLDNDESDQVLLHRKEFFATPYGKGKWVSTWADDELDWAVLEDMIERAYRKVALKRMLTKLDQSMRSAT